MNVNIKIGFFSDDHGNRSMMRLMSFLSLLASFGWAGINYGMQWDRWDFLVFFVLIGCAFFPKAIQKWAEKVPGYDNQSQS